MLCTRQLESIIRSRQFKLKNRSALDCKYASKMGMEFVTHVFVGTLYCPLISIVVLVSIFFIKWTSFSCKIFKYRSHPVLDFPPVLKYQSSALARHTIKHCPKLRKRFATSGVWSSAHVQTIVGHVTLAQPTGKERFKRRYVRMVDGGCIALDFYSNGTRLQCGPLLLVIPTLLAETNASLGICREARIHGFRAVVFNRRGQAGSWLTTPYFHVLGNDSDVRQIVTYLRDKYPYSKMTAVSLGLGSSLLLSYLGEYGSSSGVTAACCISPVFDVKSVFSHKMKQPYKWILFQKLKSILFRHSTCYSVDVVGKALTTGNILEFDLLVSGQKQSLADYWEIMNPLRDVDDISCPMLFISSSDDPICDRRRIPESLFTSTPLFMSCVTSSGGHCGFRGVHEMTPRTAPASDVTSSGSFVTSSGGSHRGGGEARTLDSRPGTWAEQTALDYLQVIVRFLKAEERGHGQRK